MAAPVGNQFWKLRSSHGRDKLFATPDLLWDAACEYFEWCEANPLPAEDFITGGPMAGQKVTLNKMRPFTMQGLCGYLDCSTGYFREFKKDCTKDFVSVVIRIEEAVYNQKFTGAASGFFNANIISRDLGLADKSDNETRVAVTGLTLELLGGSVAPVTSEKEAGG